MKDEFARREGREASPHVTIASRTIFTPPQLPLRLALEARMRYKDLSEAFQLLAELHYEAHVTIGGLSKELGFARALELARSLMQGTTDKERQRLMEPELADSMTRPLSWLYELSNRRLSTRHVVASIRSPDLLPRMSHAEHRDFVYNADTLIRGLISEALQLPLIVVRSGRAPTAY